jgi:hypothetical protein
MVGFMEPDGTSFQSANEERMEQSTKANMSSGRISRRQYWWARERKVVIFMVRSTKQGQGVFNEKLGWLCGRGQIWFNSFGVEFIFTHSPSVAVPSSRQRWADWFNPLGIFSGAVLDPAKY